MRENKIKKKKMRITLEAPCWHCGCKNKCGNAWSTGRQCNYSRLNPFAMFNRLHFIHKVLLQYNTLF